MSDQNNLKTTALHSFHKQANAKLVPFAGYDMPVNYPLGIIKEHQHTRSHAGLFDVSHMGQIRVQGTNSAELLETLMPVDIAALDINKQRYGLFLNETGGILDDLMIQRLAEDEFILVVNAACKDMDLSHLKNKLGHHLNIEMLEQQSLIALQGPEAAEVMKNLGHDLSQVSFMDLTEISLFDHHCLLSRSGYCGEDGFEISIPNKAVTQVVEQMLKQPQVEWVGLGARDSLRMEAGLPLYGHELTESTTPVEAGLIWAISKARRADGVRPGGFPGDNTILTQLNGSISRKLVGLQPLGRAPIRENILLENTQGQEVGMTTSGGFSPTLGKPICIGYVDIEHAQTETELNAMVRNKQLPVEVISLPFVERNYYRI